jgi:O-antigen ligase
MSQLVVAVGLAAAAGVLAWILARPSRGLVVGVAVIFCVPSWWSFGGRHAYQVAAVIAAISVLGARRLRPTVADCALLVYLAIVVFGWLLQYDQPETWHLVLALITPLGFYLGARGIPRARLTHLMVVAVFAGTVGAVTVIYELVRGHAVFVDPTLYKWNAGEGGIFRPGGVFGSPPGAATMLCYVLFFGFAVLPSLSGRKRSAVVSCLGLCTFALIVTFTRTALIAAAVGTLLFLWLVRSPLLRVTRLLVAGLAVAIALFVALPALERNTTFYEGIARPGTFTAREDYWRLALPIATANAHNFIFGVGTGVLETQAMVDRAPLPLQVAVTPQSYQDSLHNQYLTTLVEQGVIGVTTLVLVLLAGFVPAARAGRATGNRACAALACCILATAIVFAQDSDLDHPPTVVMLFTAVGLAANTRGSRKSSVLLRRSSPSLAEPALPHRGPGHLPTAA